MLTPARTSYPGLAGLKTDESERALDEIDKWRANDAAEEIEMERDE